MSTKDVPSLEQLAAKANEAHRRFLGARQAGEKYRVVAGLALMVAKDLVPHGGWEGWVAARCAFKIRAAQTYMRRAEAWLAADAKAHGRAPFTPREALRMLAPPPPPAEEELRFRVVITQEPEEIIPAGPVKVRRQPGPATVDPAEIRRRELTNALARLGIELGRVAHLDELDLVRDALATVKATVAAPAAATSGGKG
jgi:hypothetical protein